MNTEQVILRADGNPDMGLGHMYRLFSLYCYLRDNFSCCFLTKTTSTTSMLTVEEKINKIPLEVSLEEEPNWIKNKFPTGSILVLDGYQFDSNYQKKIKDLGFKLVYVDDFANSFMWADLVFNHSLSHSKTDYNKADYTKLYLGVNYALLRPEFIDKKYDSTKKKQGIKSIFVCYGGSDIMDFTSKTLEVLVKLNVSEINLVIGSDYENEDLLQSMQTTSCKINIFKNLNANQMVNVISNSDLAYCSASTILYEVCSLKIPVVTMYYIDNQKFIHDGFSSRGLAIGLGNVEFDSSEQFKNRIKESLNNVDLNKIGQQQNSLFDGNIKNRYLDAFNELVDNKK